MTDDGLDRARALFPDEVAAAARLAEDQASALAGMSLVAAPRSADAVQTATARASAASGARTPNPLSLARIRDGFAAGTLDPPRLLAGLLERIDRLDPELHSFVAVDREGALAAARASAARWAKGRPLGALDGVPVGVKDVIDVAGLPTRCHSRVTADAPAARDAAIVARLRAGGAVIVGKLATHEFAIGGPAFDLPFPPACNPWNVAHHPGGSSSGAGAAVAAGLVPLAIGTDTAGSVRHPASACGIVGLKPGRGALPLEGVVPLAPTLDHVGLLTRDAADMAVAAGALGVDAAPAPIGRVGYVRHFHARDMIATGEVAAALDRAAALFDAAEAALPPLADFALVNRLILQAEGYAAHGVHLRERPEQLSHLTRAALLPGAFTTAAMLAAALDARAALTAAVDAALTDFDVLLCASSMEPPCRIDDPAEIARTYMLQARGPFNVTGHPALAIGAGVSRGGLPLSIQLAGRTGEEGRLIAAAATWEAAIGGLPLPPIGRGSR